MMKLNKGAITAAALFLSELTIGNRESSNPFNSEKSRTSAPSTKVERLKILQSESNNFNLSEESFIARHKTLPPSHIYAGLPKFSKNITVVTNIGYVLAYDEQRRAPLMAWYRLGRMIKTEMDPRPSGFVIDLRVKNPFPTSIFKGRKVDRGHLAPDEAISLYYGPVAQKETFFTDNTFGQNPSFNRGVWKRTEFLESKVYAPQFEEIWVNDGSLFDDKDEIIEGKYVGKDISVEIPNSLFKIWIDEDKGRIRILSFIFPQTVKPGTNIEIFLTPEDEIERRLKLDLLSGLPPAVKQRVKNERPNQLWPREKARKK